MSRWTRAGSDVYKRQKEAAAAMNAAQDKLRNVDTEAAARRETYEQQAETADVYKRQGPSQTLLRHVK